MKKIILTLSLAFCALVMNANTIHWITFFDTTDPQVGQIDVSTRQIIYNRWINVINAALEERGYTSSIHDYFGYQTTPENCKSVIQNLLVKPEDIIVFYYVGHGGRSTGGGCSYPQMWMAQDDQSKMIPLCWVHEQLQNKGARFSLTIGMCCNSYTEGVTPKEAPTFGKNPGNTYMSDAQIKNIQKLFLGHKGSIIISSSKPGEPSYAPNEPTDLGPTDFFSYVLIKLFQNMISTGNGVSWNSYFDNICEGVRYVSGGHQNPQYEVYAPVAPVPSKPNRPEPKVDEQRTTKDNASTEDMTAEEFIEKCLEFLTDKDVPRSKRLAAADKIKKLFTSGAKVKILNQDGDVVVNTKKAADYVDVIASSTILLKVVLDDFDLNDNGQITLLKVKEFYRK